MILLYTQLDKCMFYSVLDISFYFIFFYFPFSMWLFLQQPHDSWIRSLPVTLRVVNNWRFYGSASYGGGIKSRCRRLSVRLSRTRT